MVRTSSEECFHGMAFKVKFPALKVLRLPKRVIFGISYNTSHFGPAPMEQRNARRNQPGCYYDSLNVGLEEAGENMPSVGADPAEPYIQCSRGEMTCGNKRWKRPL